jgi:hypothetical protein
LNQNERILEHLKKYGSITPKEANTEYGVMRLGARIHDLKKAGHAILTTNEKALNKYGEKIHYARYKLMN